MNGVQKLLSIEFTKSIKKYKDIQKLIDPLVKKYFETYYEEWQHFNDWDFDENGDEYHTGLGTIYQINKDGYFYIEEDDEERNIEFCLPYLYPLQNIQNIIEKHQEEFDEIIEAELDDVSADVVSVNGFIKTLNLYHKYNVDYRGLIDIGLAKDITKLNDIG